MAICTGQIIINLNIYLKKVSSLKFHSVHLTNTGQSNITDNIFEHKLDYTEFHLFITKISERMAKIHFQLLYNTQRSSTIF